MIDYFIMDVDGTLTDGKIYIGPSGETMKAFNIKDGYGIHDILIPSGVKPVIITGRDSEIVFRRASELGIELVFQGVCNKVEVVRSITKQLEKVAYIGDDLNDINCMLEVKNAGGKVGCPYDASNKVKEIADYIAPHNGGDGAIRDYIEWLLCK